MIPKREVELGNETARCFLLRSDNDGDNWKYRSIIACDLARIIHFMKTEMTKIKDRKLICFLKIQHKLNRQDNLWFIWPDDDRVRWSSRKKSSIWGYHAEVLQLKDVRVFNSLWIEERSLGIFRCISDDGLDWNFKNELIKDIYFWRSIYRTHESVFR